MIIHTCNLWFKFNQICKNHTKQNVKSQEKYRCYKSSLVSIPKYYIRMGLARTWLNGQPNTIHLLSDGQSIVKTPIEHTLSEIVCVRPPS